ncbi:MAG: polysaccharide biosynthesis/export family protein [Acidobacteria bacterium]|jgi:polysaccharide export outer membrane protein|nr:polysaccharide biosynthesis/export family protein [Acidobacteriota bacterium]
MRTARIKARTGALGRALAGAVLILTLVLSAFAQSIPAGNLPVPALRIAAGDLLSVDVFDTPELSGKLRVSEKGEIAVPVAGDVRVGGMTAEEAARNVEQALQGKSILKHPHVSVFVLEYATQGASVLGEVKNPGVYPVLGTHTLLDFISVAGGVTPNAGKAVTITHKNDPAHPNVVQLDNATDLAVRAGITILPGDTIVVSRSGVVYVVGDLVKPGGFLIENNERLTVLQAVALAQGPNRTAGLNRTRLIRKSTAGRQEIPVELGKILAGKRDDLRLEDGDILFVPASQSKTLAYRGIEATISMATGLVIYNRF